MAPRRELRREDLSHLQPRRGREKLFERLMPGAERFSAGFLSFARATYSFAGGEKIITESVRSCRSAEVLRIHITVRGGLDWENPLFFRFFPETSHFWQFGQTMRKKNSRRALT